MNKAHLNFAPMKAMIKIMAFIGLAAFHSLFAAAQDADAIIKKVKEKLATVHDYQADGVMKTDVSFMKIPESKVVIYYKNPDKFKIKKQDGIAIVPKSGGNVNLSGLFANDNYAAVPAGKGTVAGTAVTIVKLLPLDENSDIVVATLYIDEKQSLVRKAIMTTRSNGTYEMEMTYGKFASWGLPDKVIFVFNTKDYKLPKGLAFDYDTGEKPKPATATDKDQKGKLEISYTNYAVNKGLADSFFK
jgi:outer membrane lipoprotein-sorting protein